MRLLLDTHVMVWLAYDDTRVPSRVKRLIAECTEAAASVVSGWEYEQKRARHGGLLPRPFSEIVELLALAPLDFDFACHAYAGSLPHIHGDPFDRMLLGQSLHHDMPLVTSDATLRRYPVETIW